MPNDTNNLSDAYFPMLVSDGNDSVDAKFQMWVKFRGLSSERKDLLVSRELIGKIREFETRFQLQEAEIAAISLTIRKMLFGELDALQAEAKIGLVLAADSAEKKNQAKTIIEAIQKEAFTIKPVPDLETEEELTPVLVQSKVKTVRLPLLKAMSEYRHLSEQLLTNEKIKLKTSMEPVRPSLGNWLRSYREEIGIGFHETAQRGNFLFQSVNCKRLSNDDRARLNLILKSVEEDFPLEIDTTHETIIFPRTDDASMELAQVKTQPMNRTIRPRGLPANPAVAAPNIQPTTPTAPLAVKSQPAPTFKPLFGKTAAPEKNVSGETLHFSTGHVLPAEREVDTAPTGVNEALRQMQQPTQGIRREPKAPLSKSPYSIRPLRARNGGNGDI